MIRVIKFAKGKYNKKSLSEVKINKDLLWVHVSKPSLNELTKISDKFHIPLYELKRVLDTMEVPRTYNRDKYSVILFRGIYEKVKNRRSTFPFELIIGKKFVITLVPDGEDSINKVMRDFDSNLSKELDKKGLEILIYTFLHNVIIDYTDHFNKLSEKVDKIEDEVVKPIEEDMSKLFDVKRHLIYVRKYLSANKEVLEKIENGLVNYIKGDHLFHELYIDLIQVVSTGEIIKDRLTGVAELHYTFVSNKLNEVMKSFTVIASLLLLPMLVSGIYGMNIALPYDKHPQAFLIVIGIMAASVAFMLTFFRVKKWI